MFPAQADNPVRLDFWGDQLEETRAFSVATQRSEEVVPRLVAFPAREVRPDPLIRDRAAQLVRSEPWSASTWDRIVEGQIFPGIESWLPWLAEPISMIDALPEGAGWSSSSQPRLDRARELVKEESELAAALAPTWGDQAPVAGEHPALFLDLEESLARRSHLRMPSSPTGPGDPVVEISALDAIPGSPESVAAGVGRLLGRRIDTVIAMDGEAAADRVAAALAEQGLVLDRLPALRDSEVGSDPPRHPQGLRRPVDRRGGPRRAGDRRSSARPSPIGSVTGRGRPAVPGPDRRRLRRPSPARDRPLRRVGLAHHGRNRA